MSNKQIEITNVTKWFDNVMAINGINLTVAKGEVLGLIGHNGAGKSTLFKLMLGLTKATSGEIKMRGVSIKDADFRETRRRISYLPENFVTYENLTGYEVMCLFADLKKAPRSSCPELLERVGLSNASGRRVRGYSKGMRQRLGFAQALLGNPELIFLDEPTNGLDPEGIHDFYEILRNMQAQGSTIIITSHILAEIQERVDRLVILNSGRIETQGTMNELRANMVLPSVIQIRLRDDHRINLDQAFAHLRQAKILKHDNGAEISCTPSGKAAVFCVLAQMGDMVIDIVMKEPSLEQLFLGYGGHHG